MLSTRTSRLEFSSCEKNTIGDKKTGKKKRVMDAAVMALKTGLCIAACAIVVVSAQNEENELAAMMAQETQYSEENYDELGKLKFVSTPGIISVFAPIGNLQTPLADANVEFGDNYAVFTAKSDQQVLSMITGSVRYISKDEESGGQSVSIISSDEDMEFILDGLQYCLVEEGQHVERGDILGAALESEEIIVKLLESGKPIELNRELGGEK